MNHLIQERIEIIKRLKPSIGFNNKPAAERIKKLKFFGILNYALSNLLLTVVMVQAAIALLPPDASGQRWAKAGLLIFITLTQSLHGHYSYIEFLLLRHAKNLKQRAYPINPGSNKQLKEQIDHLNYHRFQPYWIIIPAGIIILGSILNYFDSNPYWEIFALPTLVISALMLWRLNNQVFLIRNNIGSIESRVGINRINLK